MPRSIQSFEVFCSPADFQDVVLDVEKFGDFMDEVVSATIDEQTEDSMTASFVTETNIGGMQLKTEYTTKYTIKPGEITWTLVSSPTLTKNEGRWLIEAGDDDDEAKVTYELELATNMPIPEQMQTMITDQLVKELADSFRNRAEELFG